MLRGMKIGFLGVALSVLTGCVTQQVKHDVQLTAVENNIERVESKQKYEDDIVRVEWFVDVRSVTSFPEYNGLNFEIHNKSKSTIKIIWDEAVYIDEFGNSHRVMHKGTKFVDRNERQPETIIPRGAKSTDTVIPSQNVHFVDGQYGGWRAEPLLPAFFPHKEAEVKAKEYSEKVVKVLLPLEHGESKTDYVFIFDIETKVVEKKSSH